MPVDIIREFLRIMIEKGADINPCRVSRTPLELAVMMYPEITISIIKLLLDYGADVNAMGDTDPGYDFIFGDPDDFSTPLEKSRRPGEYGFDEKLVELLKSRSATTGNPSASSVDSEDDNDDENDTEPLNLTESGESPNGTARRTGNIAPSQEFEFGMEIDLISPDSEDGDEEATPDDSSLAVRPSKRRKLS
jgi:hypothetical protein